MCDLQRKHGKNRQYRTKGLCDILYKKIKNISCKKEKKFLAFCGRV